MNALTATGAALTLTGLIVAVPPLVILTESNVPRIRNIAYAVASTAGVFVIAGIWFAIFGEVN